MAKQGGFIILQLTAAQNKKIQALYDQAHEAAEAGKPGMIIAQCDSRRRFRVGFISNPTAKKMVRVMNGDLKSRV